MLNTNIYINSIPTLKKKVAVDLFAGAGGFSLAALNANYEIAFAIETDKWAAETYRKNFISDMRAGTALYEADINSLNPETLAAEFFPDNSQCDLVLGGPPCQGFSTHRIRDAGVGDPRNQLIHRYFDFVNALRPKAFLMENVPGILWSRHREYLEKFYQAGEQAGYTVLDPVMLDARDFGVPQRRKRVFILGLDSSLSAEDLMWPPEATHGSLEARHKNSDLLPWLDCHRVFGPTHTKDINDIHMNHSQELVDVFANTPINGGSRKDSGRVLPCHKEHDGHKDVYGRIDPSKPAPTMTTACINPSKGRFVHPIENHGITVRQAARIQTFPESFSFYGGLTAAGKQIGNAVPIDLGAHLIRHIDQQLDKIVDQYSTADRQVAFL